LNPTKPENSHQICRHEMACESCLHQACQVPLQQKIISDLNSHLSCSAQPVFLSALDKLCMPLPLDKASKTQLSCFSTLQKPEKKVKINYEYIL
jgi:hypothetical protein